MPETFRRAIDEHSLYAIWEIEETVDELLGMIKLRKNEQALYDTFVAESRKKQWLAYRILIRSLLMPADNPIEYDESGKPYLVGSHYHISVTHSGSLAGVIISSNGLVGIDIEAIKPKIERVREKYVHPEEWEQIEGPQVHGLLTLAWCGKEAIYKLFGHKGLDFKENIRLQLPKTLDVKRFSGEIIHTGFLDRSFNLFQEQFDDYLMVYVIDTAGQKELNR